VSLKLLKNPESITFLQREHIEIKSKLLLCEYSHTPLNKVGKLVVSNRGEYFMADIVDTAVAAGSFKTLVTAVKAAGLVDTLKSKGPFTVFAPTDDAFAKLPKGTVEGLLKDVPKLKAVLTYHVVSGKVMAADVVKLTSAKTVQGQEVKIDTSKGVKVNDATVVKADVVADNGVIHVIDKVLLPK
jgi:uncharacterized surface protein with fasciclin (FAS1) repeats